MAKYLSRIDANRRQVGNTARPEQPFATARHCLVLGALGLAALVGCRDRTGGSGSAVPASSQASEATSRPLADEPIARLIDRLPDLSGKNYAVRSNIIGIGEMGSGQEKMPEGLIMLQDKLPPPSLAMDELVNRGAEAVPELVAHLGDTRLTKVPVPQMMNQWFGYEYDLNPKTTAAPPRLNPTIHEVVDRMVIAASQPSTQPAFPDFYAVGDICFDLLGQIVNRNFESVRYQPSMNIVVNCPSVLPEMRQAAAAEWGGLTPEEHRRRLLADIASPDYPERAESARKLLARYYLATTRPNERTRPVETQRSMAPINPSAASLVDEP